jgi:hypothetical protein
MKGGPGYVTPSPQSDLAGDGSTPTSIDGGLDDDSFPEAPEMPDGPDLNPPS